MDGDRKPSNAAVLGTKIGGKPVDFGVLPCGYMPLDVDTFAMDNSGTAKEHVGRTYAGVDGYCPLAAYLGTQGFCLELALRPGTQHSARETEYNIERVLPLAVKLSQASGASERGTPVLFRADSGFDSARLVCAMGQQATALKREIAFIIKWNHAPRRWRRLPRTKRLTPAPPGRSCAKASANVCGHRAWSSSMAMPCWLRAASTG